MEADALKHQALAWVTPVTVLLGKPSTNLPGWSWEMGGVGLQLHGCRVA